MRAYHRLLTAGRPSRWWVLLGVVMVGVIFLVAQTAAAGVIAAGLILGGLPPDVALDRLSGTDEITPSFLALVNIGWAAAIPAVVLAVCRDSSEHGIGPVPDVAPDLVRGVAARCFGVHIRCVFRFGDRVCGLCYLDSGHRDAPAAVVSLALASRARDSF